MSEAKPNMSALRAVTIGVAAENKKLSSPLLEVVPIEILPYLDGELVSDRVSISDDGVDAFGQKYTVTAQTANSLKATWLQWGSNRMTAPDVRRGERVILYQFADEDKFYWIPLGLDDHLRRLETAIFVFSNVRDKANTKLTIDNTYSLEVSTHAKQVTLRTSKSDGEPFAYTFQFNTKEGVVTLADDDENYIEFDSAERKITAKNKDTSFITIDKKVIKAFAPDLIHMQTKAIEAHCTTMLVEASESITMNTAAFALDASATVDITTATASVTASTSLTVTAPISTFNGMVTVTGLATLAGGLAATPGAPGAAATMSVPMVLDAAATITSAADIVTTGEVKAGPAATKLTTHTHPTAAPGGPSSPTPGS